MTVPQFYGIDNRTYVLYNRIRGNRFEIQGSHRFMAMIFDDESRICYTLRVDSEAIPSDSPTPIGKPAPVNFLTIQTGAYLCQDA
jgi:hypothetical protein